MDDNKNPLYLVSIPRSGATLLAAMLNSHKHIAMFNEPWFVIMFPKYGTFHRNQNVTNFVDDLCNAAQRFGILLGEDFSSEVTSLLNNLKSPSSLMDGVEIFLNSYFGHAKKGRWGIKQPLGYPELLRFVRKWPNLRIVHIVRDPRSTVALRMGRPEHEKENLIGALRFSRSWSQAMRQIDRIRQLHPGNFYELRYEDLVVDPTNQLKGICRFLSEEFDPEMLRYFKAKNPYVPQDETKQPLSTHADVLTPVHQRDIKCWEKFLTLRELIIVEATCASQMYNRGYQCKLPGEDRHLNPLLLSFIKISFYSKLAKHAVRSDIIERSFHFFRRAKIFLCK
jgi:hypothetical protein